MRIPATYIVFRCACVFLALLLLVLLGFGLSGSGPFSGVASLEHSAHSWLLHNTGVSL
jgi:hypothetical protein